MDSAGGWRPGRNSFCVPLLASHSFSYVAAWVAHGCSPSRVSLSQGVLPVGLSPSEQHLLCHGAPPPRACCQPRPQQCPLVPLLHLLPSSQMPLSLKQACSEVPHAPAAALAGGRWFTVVPELAGTGCDRLGAAPGPLQPQVWHCQPCPVHTGTWRPIFPGTLCNAGTCTRRPTTSSLKWGLRQHANFKSKY